LHVRPAADPVAELATAARQIKHWIVEEQVPPQEIVLATPALAADRSRIAETLASYGIPHWIDIVPPVGESPSIAALVSLLELQAGDWPYRQLLGVISCRLLNQLDAPLADSRWPTL